MASNTLNFTINLNGNAYKGILQIDDSLKGVLNSVDSARSAFKKLGDASVRFDSIVNTIGKVSDGFKFLAGDSLKFEQTQLNLQTLLGGSAEAADEMYERISEYRQGTHRQTDKRQPLRPTPRRIGRQPRTHRRDFHGQLCVCEIVQ